MKYYRVEFRLAAFKDSQEPFFECVVPECTLAQFIEAVRQEFDYYSQDIHIPVRVTEFDMRNHCQTFLMCQPDPNFKPKVELKAHFVVIDDIEQDTLNVHHPNQK